MGCACASRCASVALDQRLAALIGQVTAAARLAAAVHAPGRAGARLPGRPTRRGSRRIGRQHRARTSAACAPSRICTSAAGRHALRLAVVVALTELLVQRVALPRAYWAVVAAVHRAAPGLRRDLHARCRARARDAAGRGDRDADRRRHEPGGWGVVAVVAVLASAPTRSFPRASPPGTALLTGVDRLPAARGRAGDSVQTALDRGIDTAIGGAIGLIAYALWPTWSAAFRRTAAGDAGGCPAQLSRRRADRADHRQAPAGDAAANARARGARRVHGCRGGDRPGAQRAAPG